MQKKCVNCGTLFNSTDECRVGDCCSARCSNQFQEYMDLECLKYLEAEEASTVNDSNAHL